MKPGLRLEERREGVSLAFTATMAAQPGPQTDFLRSPADICIYDGAAGGGNRRHLRETAHTPSATRRDRR